MRAVTFLVWSFAGIVILVALFCLLGELAKTPRNDLRESQVAVVMAALAFIVILLACCVQEALNYFN